VIAHLKAIAARLGTPDVPCHVVRAPMEATPPYRVVGLPGWDAGEIALCGSSVSLSADVRVTSTAGLPEGAAILADAAKADLSPAGVETPLAVPGRRASLSWVRCEALDVDTSVTIPESNRHPAYQVDTYTLTSEPA